jgi:predicted nucleotidyltransferase
MGSAMGQGSVQQRFQQALEGLVEQVKEDRSVLAAILCGSLSHDTVWDKSDIDLVLVTIDDRKVQAGDRALYADGLNVHAFLMPRLEFRKTVEGAVRNSFVHSLLAKGRLLYTHDQSIADLCADLGQLGARDTEVQLLRAATAALGPIYKAHKWLLTRGDLEYTALFILYAATPLARIEVLDAGRLADREVIPEAMTLNPSFFKRVYVDLLNAPKTREAVQAALHAIDGYLAQRAARLFAPVLAHLQEVGEARSATDLEDHFARHLGVAGVTVACEYLADQGLVGKAATPVQLTRRSNTQVQELAFFHLGGGPPDGR